MDKNAMMQNLAREAHEKGGFNGTWLYAEHGEIVSKGAIGFRDPENTLPVTEDTIFQLASVSKTFTAAAVMLVVRQGLLNLEDKIVKFFPELTAYEGVTVRHLLNHTGGVPDYFDDMDWFFRIWNEEKRVPGNDEIVRFLCETKCKPSFAPGEGFEYSNTGYNLLALLVERLSGVPYEDFLQKNIFEPAGMTSTLCRHIRRDGIPFENFARATVLEDGKWVADVDSAKYGNVVAFDGLNGDDYVFSNVFDMLKWDRALREGKVLTLEEQQQMYARTKLNNGEDSVYDEDDGSSYGLGWSSATAAGCRAWPPGSSVISKRTGRSFSSSTAIPRTIGRWTRSGRACGRSRRTRSPIPSARSRRSRSRTPTSRSGRVTAASMNSPRRTTISSSKRSGCRTANSTRRRPTRTAR